MKVQKKKLERHLDTLLFSSSYIIKPALLNDLANPKISKAQIFEKAKASLNKDIENIDLLVDSDKFDLELLLCIKVYLKLIRSSIL